MVWPSPSGRGGAAHVWSAPATGSPSPPAVRRRSGWRHDLASRRRSGTPPRFIPAMLSAAPPPAGTERDGGPGRGAARPRRRVPWNAGPPRGGPASGSLGRFGRHLDLAVDDLLTVGVDVLLDVVDEATRRPQAHTVRGQVVDDVRAALDAAVHEAVDVRLDGVVDALEHGGHDHGLEGRVVHGVVLVGVHTDRALARGGGRLEDAEARTAGRVVNDAGAGVIHALRDDLALRRVVEPGEVTLGRDVLTVDLDLRVDRLGARDVAGLELVDQLGVDTADEADVVGLRLQGRRDAGEERALLLGEQDAGQVVGSGAGGRGVDDREVHLGVLLGDRGDVLPVREAHRDDRVVALVGELREQIGTVRRVGVGGELGQLAAVVLDGGLDTVVRGVVERTVATAAGVVGEADLQVRLLAAAALGGTVTALLVAGTGREGHAAGQQQCCDLRHPRSAQDDLLSGGTRR